MNSKMNTENQNKPADSKNDNEKGPIVEVINLNTNETVKFHVSWEETLGKVWDTAYEELKETKNPKDEFLCEGGESLMPYLGLTLLQLRDKKVCQNRKYQIRRPTGGALWRVRA
jgi:hypothetical protein